MAVAEFENNDELGLVTAVISGNGRLAVIKARSQYAFRHDTFALFLHILRNALHIKHFQWVM